MAHLPSFSTLKLNYPINKTVGEIKKEIFGSPTIYPAIQNACALRLSIALNKSNYGIRKDLHTVVKGIDGKYYMKGSRAMRRHLVTAKGHAKHWVNPNTPTKADKKSVPTIFKNKKGIICFTVTLWGDAGGHITLWDGLNFINGKSDNYISESKEIHLIELL